MESYEKKFYIYLSSNLKLPGILYIILSERLIEGLKDISLFLKSNLSILL